MSIRKNLGVLAAIAITATLLVLPDRALAATTYDIQFGAAFGDLPVVSFRSYPSAVNILPGDTIHLTGFFNPLILPAGMSQQEWREQRATFLDDDWGFIMADPDDGPQAVKFNVNIFLPGECEGSEASPCVWDGSGDAPLLLGESDEEEAQSWITITAPAGSVIYAFVGNGESPLRINVVDDPSLASTQAALDDHAARLFQQDFNDAWALHERFSSKATWHRNELGQKVFDVWVGPNMGHLESFAMYPNKVTIKKGQRVQYHFPAGNELHDAVLPRTQAFRFFEESFLPVCDPDGDAGPGPDQPADPDAQSPMELCPSIDQLEFQMSPEQIFGAGNGTFNGKNSDVEASGLRTGASLQDGWTSEAPWTVKFTKPSNSKGYRFFCTIHGFRGSVRVTD